VLRRCDGQRSMDTIVTELERTFAVQGIAAQVHDLLNEGARRGWLD
jgi:pyrroloquinoline quinone biosynthesis protein D